MHTTNFLNKLATLGTLSPGCILVTLGCILSLYQHFSCQRNGSMQTSFGQLPTPRPLLIILNLASRANSNVQQLLFQQRPLPPDLPLFMANLGKDLMASISTKSKSVGNILSHLTAWLGIISPISATDQPLQHNHQVHCTNVHKPCHFPNQPTPTSTCLQTTVIPSTAPSGPQTQENLLKRGGL